MISLIAIGLALALVGPAQAAPLKRIQHDEGSGGCGPYYYRGVGQLCAGRWFQSVPSRSVLDALRLLTGVANS